MIKKPTVLVLGAGSNREYNFPTGSELVDKIRGMITNPKNISGYLFNTEYQIPNEHIPRILAGLKRTATIDQYIESQPRWKKIFKIMIAEVISNCELATKNTIDQFWYTLLFNKMWCPKLANFHENDVVIVTFNYDRSVEYAMYSYLMKMYEGASAHECIRQMQGKIIHVYDHLGYLPDFAEDTEKELELEYGAFDFGRVAEALKTVHEAESRTCKGVQYAKAALTRAKVIGFLGFGYDKTNLSRIIEGQKGHRNKTSVTKVLKSRTLARIETESGAETMPSSMVQSRQDATESVEYYGTAYGQVDPENRRYVMDCLPKIVLANLTVTEMLNKYPILQNEP